MALLKGRLFAGVLFAGVLLSGQQKAVAVRQQGMDFEMSLTTRLQELNIVYAMDTLPVVIRD